MKEILFILALSFQSDFKTELPPIDFAIAPLDSLYGKAEKKDIWIVTLDSATVTGLHPERLKTLVYHELAHVAFRIDDSKERNHFMNPDYCLMKYSKVKKTIDSQP